MMKMIRCETDRKYESLWQQYNKLLMTEPFLPNKYKVQVNSDFSMTPELAIIISQKEEAVEEALAESEKEEEEEKCNEKTPLIGKKQSQSYTSNII